MYSVMILMAALMIGVADKPPRESPKASTAAAAEWVAYQPSTLRAPASTWLGLTDFECMEPGASGDELCWTSDSVRVCAEGVDGVYEIVVADASGFGAASLGHRVDPCISVAESHLLLTFDPPVHDFQISMARDQNDQLYLLCWSSIEDVGDEDHGMRFPSTPTPDDIFVVGVGLSIGIAACEIHGTMDNLRVYYP